MRRRRLIFAVAFTACSSGPGRTPIEQASLALNDAAVSAPLLLSLEQPLAELDELVLVIGEFSRMRLEVAVVWQSVAAPSTEWMAKFPGKQFRQYWDPQRKTPSTGGRLQVNGKLVSLERVALRVALAQYSARPH